MNSQAILYSPGANDECHTPDYAVKALIPHLPTRWTYWAPFDNESSEFVIQLRKAGLQVMHTHLDQGQDFYNFRPDPWHWDCIVSNPPFTNKAKIFERYKGLEDKITFSSAYYCSGLLPRPIMFDSLKKYGMK